MCCNNCADDTQYRKALLAYASLLQVRDVITTYQQLLRVLASPPWQHCHYDLLFSAVSTTPNLHVSHGNSKYLLYRQQTFYSLVTGGRSKRNARVPGKFADQSNAERHKIRNVDNINLAGATRAAPTSQPGPSTLAQNTETEEFENAPNTPMSHKRLASTSLSDFENENDLEYQPIDEDGDLQQSMHDRSPSVEIIGECFIFVFT